MEARLSDTKSHYSEHSISRLLAHAESPMRDAIRRKLRVSLNEHDHRTRNVDALELLSAVRLKVLQKLREPDAQQEINSIAGYAASAAYHACSDLLRTRFPRRTRLANMLRRVCEKSERVRVVWDSPPDPVIALESWPHTKRAASAAQVVQLRSSPVHQLPGTLPRKAIDEISPPELSRVVEGVLDRLGGPLRFDDLLAITAAFLQVEDIPDESLADGGDAYASAGAVRQHGGFSLWLSTERMRLLWDALAQILPWHRAAFLLNLRNGDIGAFPYYGIASVEQIGESLGLTANQYSILANALALTPEMRAQLSILSGPGQRFAIFWNYLPLEDSIIGTLLGVQRSQVIAYRNKAVERLRRMLAPIV